MITTIIKISTRVKPSFVFFKNIPPFRVNKNITGFGLFY